MACDLYNKGYKEEGVNIKKKKFKSLLLVSILLLSIVLSTLQVNATYYPTQWLEKKDVGKLRYGLSRFLSYEGGTPDVHYIQSDEAALNNTTIQHIYTSSSGVATSPFNLIGTTDEYLIDGGSSGNFKAEGGVALFNDSTRTLLSNLAEPNKEAVIASGSKLSDTDLKISLEQYANANQDAVVHKYTFTNTSKTETKTVYPMKRVDTKLNDNDQVPVYSRGAGQGIYIKTPQDPNNLKKGNYRLDYYTNGIPDNSEHFPVLYAAAHQNGAAIYTDDPNIKRPFPSVFGDDLDNQGTDVTTKSMTAAADVDIPINQRQNGTDSEGNPTFTSPDSGIFMSWGKVTLAPGESYTARYDVGISVDTNTKKSKTAKNLTRSEGKAQIGDVIEYTISYESANPLSDITIQDKLSEGFDAPTEDIIIEDVNGTNGNPTSIPISQAYDSATHTLNIPGNGSGLKLVADGKINVKFKVTLGEKATGMNINNTAEFRSKTTEDTYFNEKTTTDKPVEVENKGTVTVKYVDEEGNTLKADDTLSGIIGKPYDATGMNVAINGYDYSKSTGSALTGSFTTDAQTITFVYKEHRFDLVQKVTNEAGESVDGKEVDMGQKVTYTTDLKTKLTDATSSYQNFNLVANVSPNVENIDNITLKTTSGKTLTYAKADVYDEGTNTITITLDGSESIASTEDLTLSYDATVKNLIEVDVVASSSASGNYSDGMVAKKVDSNVVTSRRGAGNLELTTPSEFNFGVNEISSKEEDYSLSKLSEDIIVKDNRAPGKNWVLNLSIAKDFENTSTGDKLPGILKFKKSGVKNDIPVDGSDYPIQNGTTTADNRGTAFNISQDWVSKKEGLILSVPGGLAKAGNYEAELTWNLVDAP
ncbi:MucBP domain-containing protein [Vagococcus sp. JNUCC 83]